MEDEHVDVGSGELTLKRAAGLERIGEFRSLIRLGLGVLSPRAGDARRQRIRLVRISAAADRNPVASGGQCDVREFDLATAAALELAARGVGEAKVPVDTALDRDRDELVLKRLPNIQHKHVDVATPAEPADSGSAERQGRGGRQCVVRLNSRLGTRGPPGDSLTV